MVNDLDCRDRRGTNTGYRRHMAARATARAAGCPEARLRPTCPECRRARADWQRGYAARLYLARGPLTMDAAGSRRRLQALAVMGWDFVELGRRLGISGSSVSKMASRSQRVSRVNAEKVRGLYDELSMLRGENKVARTRALMKGWCPPLAWDEDTIDDPLAKAQGVA